MQIDKSNCIPEFLYKYRPLSCFSLSRLLDIIKNKNLYFAGIDDFNDPFEFAHNLTFEAKNDDIKIDFIKQQIVNNDELFGYLLDCKSNEEKIKKYESNQPLKLMSQSNDHNIRKKLGLGVLCLSSSCENINLWSHYADSHKGICIKFKLNKNLANFFKVIYTSDPSISFYEQYNYEEIAKRKWDKFWNHEVEYRAIRNKGSHNISDLGLEIDSLYLGINFFDNPCAQFFINNIENIIDAENIKIFQTIKGNTGTYSIKFNQICIWNIRAIINANNKVKNIYKKITEIT